MDAARWEAPEGTWEVPAAALVGLLQVAVLQAAVVEAAADRVAVADPAAVADRGGPRAVVDEKPAGLRRRVCFISINRRQIWTDRRNSGSGPR